MLLCRIVGYRPFLYATLRDEQRDDRQRSITNWNSEEGKFDENSLLMNKHDVADDVLPQLVRTQRITIARQNSFQKRKFVSHGQNTNVTQDLCFSHEVRRKEERTIPRRFRHHEIIPEDIHIYGNARNIMSSPQVSRLDCTILQKPMLARPAVRKDSPVQQSMHLPPVDAPMGPSSAAAAGAAAAGPAAGAQEAVCPPAPALSRGSLEELNFQSLDEADEAPFPERARPLAESNTFSRSLPSTRNIGILSSEERQRAFRYRQLKALELSPRMADRSDTKDPLEKTANRRGVGGTSAPATLDGERPTSIKISAVTEQACSVDGSYENKITSPLRRDTQDKDILVSENSVSRQERPESSFSRMASSLNAKSISSTGLLASPSNNLTDLCDSSKIFGNPVGFSISINNPNPPLHIQNISRRTGISENSSRTVESRLNQPSHEETGTNKVSRKHLPGMGNGNLRLHTPAQEDSNATENIGELEEENKISPSSKKAYKGPFPNELRPLARPRDTMIQCLQLLDNPEWETVMQGMQTLVCLLTFHTMLPVTYVHSIMALLAKQVRNLRSQVSRAACMVSSELFSSLGKAVENDLDELAGSLFHRSADTNKFLRADCNTALDSMLDAVSPSRAVSVIVSKGASHHNAIVRTTAARLLYAVVSKMGTDRFMAASQDMRDKVILTGCNFLTEGSLDTRCHAKQILRCLSKHENFNQVLQEVLPATLLRQIRKALQNLK